ncbi:MAG: nickel-dependent lactate racemase [Bacteroidales bacterium]
MIQTDLKYGISSIPVNIPEKAVHLSHTEPPADASPGQFKKDLRSCLYMIRRKVRSVGIVVSDKTRLCQYPVYLPLLTEALMEYGFSQDQIIFYIAYGTHLPQTDQESLASYGETFRDFRFVHHDSRDEGQVTLIGTTTRGTRITVRKDILDHDLLITFGSVLHHYFAGFGGGRKLLFPGLAGYNSILQNHSLYLDHDRKILREGCEAGRLEGNPLAMDLEEISTFLPDRVEIHAILNSRKEVSEIHFGSGYEDFREVCERYDTFFRVQGDDLFDMVVASAGGYPKDINFIQTHKSIHNAASFVKDGGTLVLLAECADGIGNRAFMDIFRSGNWKDIFNRMKINYENNAGTALAMLHKSKRIRICFVTSLDEKSCRLMGAVKTSPEQVQELISGHHGEMAWIENASMLYR